jgi:hypothetical protein
MLCIQGNLSGSGMLGFLPKFANVIFTIQESLVLLILARGHGQRDLYYSASSLQL